MRKRLYLGNLPWSFSEEDLRQLFAEYSITSAQIISDKETGKPRGFGFVELALGEDLDAVIADLDGREVGGRSIRVSMATERLRGGDQKAR